MRRTENTTFEELHGRKMLYFHEQDAVKRAKRRKTTKNVNSIRKKNAKDGIYSFQCGYWIKDWAWVGYKAKKTIPAHDEPVYKEMWEYRKVINPVTGEIFGKNVLVTRKAGIKHIPERTVNCNHRKLMSATPVLKRMNTGKKAARKMMERKVRHYNGILNHGDYRKAANMWNELW